MPKTCVWTLQKRTIAFPQRTKPAAAATTTIRQQRKSEEKIAVVHYSTIECSSSLKTPKKNPNAQKTTHEKNIEEENLERRIANAEQKNVYNMDVSLLCKYRGTLWFKIH